MDMTHNISQEALIKTIDAVLQDQPDVAFAYLFGSRAKGKARASSDVDVALFLDPAPDSDLQRQFELQTHIETAIGIPTDLIILNHAPPELAYNVLHTGVPIAIRDTTRHRLFYVDQARTYYDMEPARRLFARCMTKRLEGGTFGGGSRNHA
jgi:predicted nucleotidyltransferase